MAVSQVAELQLLACSSWCALEASLNNHQPYCEIVIM